MKNIALELAKTADTILNGFIILVLIYFVIIIISVGVREIRDAQKQRKRLG